MSLTPKVTATDPPPANSPTMHSRMVCEDPKIIFFCGPILDHFWDNFFFYCETSFLSLLLCRDSVCNWSFWPKTVNESNNTLKKYIYTIWFNIFAAAAASSRTSQLIDWIGIGAYSVKRSPVLRMDKCLAKVIISDKKGIRILRYIFSCFWSLYPWHPLNITIKYFII